jgi:hypothetical protein
MNTPTKHPRGALFCTACHTVDRPKLHTKGSLLIELVLWLCLLLPGLLYSLWRHGTRAKVCRRCKSPDLIPPDSPRARQAVAAPAIQG